MHGAHGICLIGHRIYGITRRSLQRYFTYRS
jgi:hypothetical protein